MAINMKKIYIPSFGEEVANSISHGVFSVLALLALPVAAVIGYNRGGIEQMIGLSIFMISIFLMLLTSTLCQGYGCICTSYCNINKYVVEYLKYLSMFCFHSHSMI